MQAAAALAGLLLGSALTGGCDAGDPGIGLSLGYAARQPTQIVSIDFDGERKMDGTALPLHLGAAAIKHEAVACARLDCVPRLLSARWRYQSLDAADEAALQALPDSQIPWREARAEIALRSRLDAEALVLLRREPGRHRLRLVLEFDRDRLLARWQVQRWR
jgi:hypothetical protein